MVKTRTVSQALKRIDLGLLVAAALALFAVQPLLQPGLPTSADLAIHLYRTLEYGHAWTPDVLIPRWAPNLAYGYGYPLFIFAPPLPYLLALGLQSTGLTLELAFKLLLVLTVLLYALGMYLLARDLLQSAPAGLVAATAYALAPFALREALLYGGNVPQYLAIGLFPWVLWSLNRAVVSARFGWTLLSGFFYAGVMLSHLFQVLIFSPVFGFFILLRLLQQRAGQTMRLRQWHPLLAPVIGLLLSAFFWLPVLTERSFTRAESSVYLEKSPFFVRYPHPAELIAWIEPLDFRAANPYVPLTLGVVTLALAGLGLLAALMMGRRRPAQSLTLLFFGLVAAGSVAMSLPVSRLVWETVEILQVAEFPWRMLGLANLGLAILAGAALWLASPRRQSRLVWLCLPLQLWAVGAYLYPVVPFTDFKQRTLADQIQYERSSQSIGTTTLGEYLPAAVSQPPGTSPLVDSFQANQNPERLDRASLPPEATATLLEQTAVTHRYRLNSPASFTLRLFHFYYPGWQATLDGRAVPIDAEAETGLMLLDIPGGTHELTIVFQDTGLRRASLIVSGITLGVSLALLLGLGLRSMAQPSTKQTPPAKNILPRQSALLLAVGLALTAFLIKPILQPVFTRHSPNDRVLAAEQATDIVFENGIRLVGYAVSQQVVEPGGYLQLVLYWETDGAPHRVNLQPFVHLDRLDTFTTVAGSTNYTPGDVTTEMNMPTFHWDNSRYVRDEHDLYLPADLPALAYAVRIGLIDPDQNGQLVNLAGSNEDTAWLDTLNVTNPAPTPALARPLTVTFRAENGDRLVLTGYELSSQTTEQLDFNLTWQTGQRLQADYTVFAQLLTANGQLVAGFDQPPLNGAYPTTTWLPDQTILDPRSVPLIDVPPGQYTLIIGVYNPVTGQRPQLETGADYVALTTITVP